MNFTLSNVDANVLIPKTLTQGLWMEQLDSMVDPVKNSFFAYNLAVKRVNPTSGGVILNQASA